MTREEKDKVKLRVPQGDLSQGLNYVAEYLFHERLGLDLEFLESSSAQSIALEVPDLQVTFNFGRALPISQMENEQLSLSEIDFSDAKIPVIFPDSSLPLKFDILSGVFFFLSRYEEYIIRDRDAHGRFCAKHSIQNEWDTLRKPLVDIWVEELRIRLKSFFPSLDIKEDYFDAINTYDIDQPFALRGKPFLKVAGRAALDVLGFKISSLKKKLRYFLKGVDPFEDWLGYLKLTKNPHVFFLMAGDTQFDKNVQVGTRAFSELVLHLLQKVNVGLHPSYDGQERNSLALEKRTLEEICGVTITKSRQHYLRFSLPETPRWLITEGIHVDYSLGFPDAIGFRAGTSRPFPFFDLERQKTTSLQLVPFSVMDVTLRNYLKLSPKQAMDSVELLINEVRASKGLFVSLWHNESLSEIDGWHGWTEVHNGMLKYQKNQPE